MNSKTRFAWKALARIRLFATEIESDLLPKADVKDWYRGTRDEYGSLKLSSRRLLVLTDKLPVTSAYKRALRGGYWTVQERIAADTHNEVAWLRAAFYSANGGEDGKYEPDQWIDPMIELQQAIQESEENDEHADDSEKFYGDMGFT